MKITGVEVGYGYTMNIGNYESKRSYVAFSATIEHGETKEEVIDKLEGICREEVERILKDAIRNKNKKTAKDYF